MPARPSLSDAVSGRHVFLTAAMFVLVTFSVMAQAQSLDTNKWKAVEACQKVARKDSVQTKDLIASARLQFRETTDQLLGYIHKYGDRVVAGSPQTAEAVRACVQTFDDAVLAIETRLLETLSAGDERKAVWYDEKTFRLLTDVLSSETIDKIVKEVEGHLQSAIKEFRNLVVSSLKESISLIKPAYQKVSRCIREESVLANYR